MRWLVFVLLLAGCSSSPPPPPVATPTASAGNVFKEPEVRSGMAPVEAPLDFPLFPGAKQVGKGALRPESAPEAVLGTQDLETSAPVAEVEKFYRAELGKVDVTRLAEKDYELVTLKAARVYVTISRTGAGPTRINLTRQR